MIGLGDVLPGFAMNDGPNIRLLRVQRSADLAEGMPSRVHRANPAHIVFGQFRATVPGASRCSALLRHIRRVLGFAPKEEMARVAAPGVIPVRAIVANDHVAGDWTFDDFVGDAMRTNVGVIHPQIPVSKSIGCALPLPARIGATGSINPLPDVLWLVDSRLLVAHRGTELLRAVTGAVKGCPALRACVVSHWLAPFWQSASGRWGGVQKFTSSLEELPPIKPYGIIPCLGIS
jgi:hypothetical protein